MSRRLVPSVKKGSLFSSRRAPNPTEKGKKGVSTVNVKHLKKSQGSKQLEEVAAALEEDTTVKTSKRKIFAGRGSERARRKQERNDRRRARREKKRMKKANTKSTKDDGEFSEGHAIQHTSSGKNFSLKGTMPRKMKNMLSNFYTKKKPTTAEATDSEIDFLNTERELEEEADTGFYSPQNDKFKETIMKKYGGVGTYGFTSFDAPNVRKESSFGAERPMVLLLGRSRAGKSTVFKQLMSLSGAPPNYARAYRATKSPVEEDVTINDADFTLVDVGGSSDDIVDWRFYLSNAEVIVYVVALDEYDKVVPGKEGDATNPPYTYLKESLELFDSIVNNVALLNSKFVLVFNKVDRFKKKLTDKKVALADTRAYEDAPAAPDYDDSIEYIEEMFMERSYTSEHDVEVEFTSAIDAEECHEVLERITQRLARSKDVTKWKNLL